MGRVNESMSDLPVAAPDHAETIRDALAYWSDTSIGSEEEREIHDAALAALDALLAERQQDKEYIEELLAERETGPLPHKCLNSECGTIEYGPGYKRCPGCGGTDGRAALAVEEDTE